MLRSEVREEWIRVVDEGCKYLLLWMRRGSEGPGDRRNRCQDGSVRSEGEGGLGKGTRDEMSDWGPLRSSHMTIVHVNMVNVVIVVVMVNG